MKNFLLSLLTVVSFLTACDDGDIIVEELNFEDTFKVCGSLVLYKVKSDPAETLSLYLSSDANYNSVEDILEVEISEDFAYATVITPQKSFTLNGTSNILNYRTYEVSGSSEISSFFCNDVPPSDIKVISDETSSSGTVYITTILLEDDNDGIPAELEDKNLDGDNNPYTNPTDTDGDGIPDFLDSDDDGDNVKTLDENPNYNEDTGMLEPQDTDGNGIPDYLDPDDDGDGVPTINEEGQSSDSNPTNDIENPSIGPDYLNPQVTTNVPATQYRTHSILQTFTVHIWIENVQLPSISLDELDFGTLNDSNTTKTRTFTPNF